MSTNEIKEGWGWPGLSPRAHYFVGGRSLCGKWGYGGNLEQGNNGSPDNCSQCKKKLEKTAAAAERKE